jgi:outer membrane receptor protein involved in Fe transport
VVDVLITGGSPNNQFRKQSGTLLQDDLTFTGMAGHTIKGGVKIKHISYDLSGTARAVDQIYERIDTVTGVPSIIRTDPAIPPSGVDFSNNQYGIYFQDDWQATDKLLLNLGLRYDYEDNMLNDTTRRRPTASPSSTSRIRAMARRRARPMRNRWPRAASTSATTSAPAATASRSTRHGRRASACPTTSKATAPRCCSPAGAGPTTAPSPTTRWTNRKRTRRRAARSG